MRRLCVFCGSSSGDGAGYVAAGRELANAAVVRGYGIVYGGARIGVMGAVADAAMAAGGEVIGVIPGALAAKEIAHDGLTELHVVDSMHERKATMADHADAFVALPGGIGTLEEIFEVLTWAQLGIHDKPCALLNVRGYFDPLLSFLDRAVDQRFIRPQHRAMLLVAGGADDLLDALEAYQPPAVAKWLDRTET